MTDQNLNVLLINFGQLKFEKIRLVMNTFMQLPIEWMFHCRKLKNYIDRIYAWSMEDQKPETKTKMNESSSTYLKGLWYCRMHLYTDSKFHQ